MPQTLHDVFDTANQAIDNAGRIASRYLGLLAGDTAATVILDLYRDAWAQGAAIGSAAAWDRDDLRTYAQEQWALPAADITAKAVAVKTTYVDIATTIAAMFPQDGNGYLLHTKLLNGQLVIRELPSASLSTIRSKLQALATAAA